MEPVRKLTPDELAVILNTCLEQMNAGASLDQALQPFTDLTAEIRPLLIAATQARTHAASIRVPPGAQNRSRAKFLNAAQVYANPPRRSWLASLLSGVSFSRLATAALIFLVMVVVGGFSAAAASAQALPGDVLYSVKLASEQTRLLLARDASERLALEQNYAERRAAEIRTLISRGRSAEVSLSGLVVSASSGEILVQDFIILITEETNLNKLPEVGDLVQVTGRLQQDGTILAYTIRIQQGGATRLPDSTPTQIELTSTPTVTPTRVPTQTLEPSHTPTATDDDNENDDSNDNEDGNEDNGNDNDSGNDDNGNDNDNDSGNDDNSNDNDNDNGSDDNGNDNDNDNDNDDGSNDNDNDSGSNDNDDD